MKLAGTCLIVFLLALTLLPGCSRSSEASDSAAKKQTTTAVTKIGFLDQVQCCKCTRDRIEKSWAALQVALDKKSIQVERVHIDSQEAQAGPYRLLRLYQVIPAIYFLDGNGKLVEMLQGQVSEDAIRKLLK